MVLESGGWTVYDTMAGILSLVLVSGYLLTPVEHLVVTALDLVFAPLVTVIPFTLFFFGLAGVTGASSTVIRYCLHDHEQLDRLQSRLTELQEALSTAHDGDSAGTEELSPEHRAFVNSWIATMKLQFRPVVWSLLVTVPVFLWLRWAMIAPTAAAVPVALTVPIIGSVPLSATLIGPIKVWLAWYVGGSVSASVLSRRLLDHVTA